MACHNFNGQFLRQTLHEPDAAHVLNIHQTSSALQQNLIIGMLFIFTI